MRLLFTPEELAELEAADAEIEMNFHETQEDIERSRELERDARIAALPFEKRKIAERQRAYYEANRDKIAERQRAYYEANRDKIAESQRAKLADSVKRAAYNAYMREYRRKRREQKKAASPVG